MHLAIMMGQHVESRATAKEEGTWCDSVTVVENSQDSMALRGTLPFVQCECSVIKVYRLKRMVESYFLTLKNSVIRKHSFCQ